jgi:hypothetical protein
MKILIAWRPAERNTPSSSEATERIGKRQAEEMKAGEVFTGERYLPNALGTSTCKSKGKIHVTDGPFTESKEVIGGLPMQRKAGFSGDAEDRREPITFGCGR